MVRQGPLKPPFEGSNPSSPANKYMKTYDTVILLAMGIEASNNGNYILTGDPFEFRFKAIKRLYEQGVSRFILVGGTVLGIVGVSKPDVMENILTEKYGVPKECLIKLVSENNTEGNAKKIQEYANGHKDLGITALVTNFFHLPRATTTFLDFTDIIFKPVSAESIVYDTEHQNIRNFYQNEGLDIIIKEKINDNSEIKGIHDKELGTYKSGIS